MQKCIPPLPSIPFDAPCPFDMNSENFSRNSLTGKVKEWIGAQLYYQKITAVELGRIYNIPTTTLSTYKKKVMNWKNIRDNGGRPPLLDDLGVTELHQEFQGRKYQITKKDDPTP